ncbi:uncharacterized protein LOC127259480 [Andrographis paniculata]|uniref:uncharacterized protein LOC127259480 n=1 Tax=Andrographis paniculata TaxID=175694 RepID=UPI0021E87CD0|nr:uncharacterized protein LOC127259480 [Andrographis paniculata]
MEGQVAAVVRRQPLLMEAVTSSTETDGKTAGSKGRWSRMGETAGECTAVCCCCPCGMMHLLILAVYRLPAGIWREKRRRRLLRKRRKFLSAEKERNIEMNFSSCLYTDEEEESEAGGDKNDVVEWENEVLDRFYMAGFWRSNSDRDDD